jgi:hypothetical protein
MAFARDSVDAALRQHAALKAAAARGDPSCSAAATDLSTLVADVMAARDYLAQQLARGALV